jgi:hypothetical protein
MGAHFHIELTLQAAHRIAVDDASAWRGRCINLFARAERVVAVAISTNKKSAKTQLFGKRLGLLADAMAGDPSILAMIESLQSLVETRNTIVHCEGHVFVDLKGHWILEFEDGSGEAQLRISKSEAEILRRRIQQSVDRLKSKLEPNSRSLDPVGTPSA